MAKNVVREFGAPVYGTTKNIASAKLSGDLISFPLTAGAGVPVALLTADAASSADGVSCLLGGVVVRYAALSTDTADPGTVLYFDSGNNRLTTTASTHNKAGRAAKTKLSGDTTADVYLNMV
jgi:predicted RecA/RadA family phage recombinase